MAIMNPKGMIVTGNHRGSQGIDVAICEFLNITEINWIDKINRIVIIPRPATSAMKFHTFLLLGKY